MKLSTTSVGHGTKMMKLIDITSSEAMYFARLEVLFPKLVHVHEYDETVEVEIHFKAD